MKVLYLNHTGAVSGAERSLLDLVGNLPPGIEGILASPPGALHAHAARRGIPVRAVGGTDASLSTSATEAPRAVASMLAAGWQVARTARACGADVIHANSIRAGLIAVAAAHVGGPPAVVHLRDTLAHGHLTTATLRSIAHGAAAVIGNSEYTVAAFREVAPNHGPLYAIHNPIDLDRFSPDAVGRRRARREFDLGPDDLAVGVVGQITPWKGQDTAIRAVATARRALPNLVLLIAGEAKFVSAATRYDNRAYLASLHELVAEHRLGNSVRFLGEREDVPQLMRALDSLLVPSWEEPFGRVVVEGLAMGLPIIATDRGGPAEIISHEADGVLLPADQPDEWAVALSRIAVDRELRARLVRAGPLRARDFGVQFHVDAVLQVYDDVLSRPGGSIRQLARRLDRGPRRPSHAA